MSEAEQSASSCGARAEIKVLLCWQIHAMLVKLQPVELSADSAELSALEAHDGIPLS
jgi:hypothetical protein